MIKKKTLILVLLIGFLIFSSAFFFIKIKYKEQEKLIRAINISIEKYGLVVPLATGPSGEILEINNCSEEKTRIESSIKSLNESSNLTEHCLYIHGLLMGFAIYCDQKIDLEEIKRFYKICKNSFPFLDVVTLGIFSYASFLEDKSWICGETTEERVMEYLTYRCDNLYCALLHASSVYNLCNMCNYTTCISYICNFVNQTSLDEVKKFGEVAIQRYKTFTNICNNK